MDASKRNSFFVTRSQLASLAPALVLAVLFLALPPDGKERWPWLLFFGKFHLLTIHFPIALLYLVPVMELAGRMERFPYLKASVEFVLVLAMLGSLFAASLGWALARSGGYSGRLVMQHMWGGLFTALACWVCWLLRDRVVRGEGALPYFAVLAVAVAVVSFTGYRGGQLTQGENHLTDSMPAALKKLLGVSSTKEGEGASGGGGAAAVNRTSFYGARVEPILAANCYSCHGADKQRGQLRLDSYNAIMRGGKHGLILKPGDAKASELFRRINLPQTDDDAMPPQGHRALTPDEIATIQAWIAAGAPELTAADKMQGAPKPVSDAPVEVALPDYDPNAAAKARAAHAADVTALEKKYPNALEYESRTSAELTLNASLLGDKFGDADIAALKPVLDQITKADFSGTAITDQSAASIAAMKDLRMLRLAHTHISDSAVQRLQGMAQLQSINLLGTAVTPASLNAIASMPKLQHAYVAETKIPSSAASTPTLKQKLIF